MFDLGLIGIFFLLPSCCYFYYYCKSNMSELVTVSLNLPQPVCTLRYCGLNDVDGIDTRYAHSFIAFATIKTTNQCIVCARYTKLGTRAETHTQRHKYAYVRLNTPSNCRILSTAISIACALFVLCKRLLHTNFQL